MYHRSKQSAKRHPDVYSPSVTEVRNTNFRKYIREANRDYRRTKSEDCAKLDMQCSEDELKSPDSFYSLCGEDYELGFLDSAIMDISDDEDYKQALDKKFSGESREKDPRKIAYLEDEGIRDFDRSYDYDRACDLNYQLENPSKV